MKNKLVMKTVASLTLLALMGCGSSSGTGTVAGLAEDTSASGAAAAAIGGAIASSSSSGTVSFNERSGSIWSLVQPQAFAANQCPTVKTAAGAGCAQTSANNVDITYSPGCSFGMSTAVWNGILEISLSTAGPVTCGTFPTVTGKVLQRQFVSVAGAPGTAGVGTRTSAAGTIVNIDHQTANLGNFDNQTIAAIPGASITYGNTVTFNASNARTNASVRQRVYVTGGFDHSVVASINLSETATTRTATGTATVYHNKLKVVGISTFNNVTYNDTSCLPVSGSISTTFAAGANVVPTTAGAAYVTKTESIAFNADATATLTDPSGATSTVKLSHCY